VGKLIPVAFISLDGVVQAPGGREEDTDGGFRHGGWADLVDRLVLLIEPVVLGRRQKHLPR
jgi:hypothetical protein